MRRPSQIDSLRSISLKYIKKLFHSSQYKTIDKEPRSAGIELKQASRQVVSSCSLFLSIYLVCPPNKRCKMTTE